MRSRESLFRVERERPKKTRPELTPAQLADRVSAHVASLSAADHERLRRILWEDVTSEFDERFLTSYLESSGLEFTEAFRRTIHSWSFEERRHHEGFRAVYARHFGSESEVQERLAERTPDFTGFEALLGDEFRIACLAAYDEYATVRVYTRYLEYYDLLGPEFGHFVRRVIRDEAHHYANFMATASSEFPDRRVEVPKILDEIRALEGKPYRATFLLDHDDPVFSSQILARAEQALLRHLGAG